jgi:hypothetical protein
MTSRITGVFWKRKRREGPRPPRATDGIMLGGWQPVEPVPRPIGAPPKPADAHLAIPPQYRTPRD